MSKPLLVPGCDAPEPRPVYVIRLDDGEEVVYGCRCMVCARCNHHTGNTNQGHWWAFCKVTRRNERFHFCCPDDCELLADNGDAS